MISTPMADYRYIIKPRASGKIFLGKKCKMSEVRSKMSEIGDIIQTKCMAFADRIIKLNDYLLEQASKREEVRSKKEKSGRIPIQLLSVANLCNQLLRSGTSIGANDAEACNAISKADFKSKSFIALKEARESLFG